MRNRFEIVDGVRPAGDRFLYTGVHTPHFHPVGRIEEHECIVPLTDQPFDNFPPMLRLLVEARQVVRVTILSILQSAGRRRWRPGFDRCCRVWREDRLQYYRL